VSGTTNVTGIVVQCKAGNTIGGTVSGLGLGKSLVLLDNGGNALKIVNNGQTPIFRFTQVLATGATFNVTVGVQPVGELCTVAHGTGTVSGNVTGIVVTCKNAATIGGKVSGLEVGETLILLDNGGDALTLRNRLDQPSLAFAFSTALPGGATFDVTVGTQPLGEICTVLGGSGMVSGTTNVTGIRVDCQ
jgi:hypothetical protein